MAFVSTSNQVLSPTTSTCDVNNALLTLVESGILQNDDTLQEVTKEPSVGAIGPQASNPQVQLNDERVHLLNVYRTGVATWMDIFDHECTYQYHTTERALCSDLILRSVCAFTAQHLSLLASGQVWRPIAARYYGEALAILIGGLHDTGTHGDVLTAVILLCSYEIISAQAHEHQRHGEGATKLIRLHGINANSYGIQRANFWIYVRHELSIALSNETCLNLNPETWDVTWPGVGAGEDRMANYLMWLAARTINLNYAAGNTDSNERNHLKTSLIAWHEATSSTFRGIPYESTDNAGGLHKIHFAHPTAAAAMLWYHLICIMLNAETEVLDPASGSVVRHHAIQILDISDSDMAPGARCFSIWPIFFAGKHVQDVKNRFRACVHLDDIQRRLGYRTSDQLEQLQYIDT